MIEYIYIFMMPLLAMMALVVFALLVKYVMKPGAAGPSDPRRPGFEGLPGKRKPGE